MQICTLFVLGATKNGIRFLRLIAITTDIKFFEIWECKKSIMASQMLSSEQNVQECDAMKADSSNAAG